MDCFDQRQHGEIEDAATTQRRVFRDSQDLLRSEQMKELRAFNEGMMKEMKSFHQESTMLSVFEKKNSLEQRKQEVEMGHGLLEQDFLLQLQQNTLMTIQMMTEKHEEELESLKEQYSMRKHSYLRVRDNNILEDEQTKDKFVLQRKQLNDEYCFLRSQLYDQHRHETTQIRLIHVDQEEKVIQALSLDLENLLKMLFDETESLSVMFKESLHFDKLHQEEVIELDWMENGKRKQLLENERAVYHEMKGQENLISTKKDFTPLKTPKKLASHRMTPYSTTKKDNRRKRGAHHKQPKIDLRMASLSLEDSPFIPSEDV